MVTRSPSYTFDILVLVHQTADDRTCWSAFANKNQESRQFLTRGVTGAEVVTNVLFSGASSLQYLTICNVSRMLNNNIADGGSIRTLVVWCVAGIEAVMFIAELVLWGIRCGVANQTCGWKQNQERLISRYLSLLTRGDPLQKWQEGYFLHLCLCLCALCRCRPCAPLWKQNWSDSRSQASRGIKT